MNSRKPAKAIACRGQAWQLVLWMILALLMVGQVSSAGKISKASQEPYRALKIPEFAQFVAFSPDGRLLACASFPRFMKAAGPDPIWTAKTSVTIWNTQTGRLVYKAQVGSWILELCFSPDGLSLATLETSLELPSNATVVRVRDVQSLRSRRKFPHADVPWHWLTTSRRLAFSHNGKILAVGDCLDAGTDRAKLAVVLYDLASGLRGRSR